jgi:hypothetical protein
MKIIKFSFLLALVSALLIGVLSPGAFISTAPAYGQGPYIYHLPLFFNQTFAPASPSYYMTTLNSGFIYDLGCELGTRDKYQSGVQDNVVVLAFGYPRCFEGVGYGANLFGYGPATLEDIQIVIKHFAAGYYICTGDDNDSNLVIGVGTSNYRGGTEPCETESKAADHGTAWSGMVKQINQWLLAQGIFHQVQAFGANDIELGWNSPTWSRAWLAGFEKVSGNVMLHFGDAAGCPYEDKPHWSCGTSSFPQWTMEDVWFVSYGSPSALPLPLIYLTTGVHAKQWAYLSQYSVQEHGYRMDFSGVFTQWAACQQFGNCDFIDNTPEQAYQQLSYELNKFPATAQYLRWKTDIRWILQSELTSAGITQDDIPNAQTDHPLQRDATALATALETPDLSSTINNSLVIKMMTFQNMADMAAISKSNPAPKNTPLPLPLPRSGDPVFQSGIFQNGEFLGQPYGVNISNIWQAQTEIGYLQVAAGVSPEDPQRGAVYLVLASPDRLTFQSELVLAPQGCDILSITSEGENQLYLQSENGCQLMFDLRDFSLTQGMQ